MSQNLNLFWHYLKLYFGIVSSIGVVIGIYSVFQPDSLKAFSSSWWIVFVLPLGLVIGTAIYHSMTSSATTDWAALINAYLPDARIYGRIYEEPRIEITGRFPLSKDEEKAARAKRFKINDIHAMISEEPLLLQSPVTFMAKTLTYAALDVLREKEIHEFILSSSVVLVCPARQVLILHHRSCESRTYPDRIHTIGGSFQPSVDRNSLRRTAHREVDEETEASVLVEDSPPMILVLERPTKFLQLVFLGASISAKQCDRLHSNWEAEGIIKVPFRELRKHLTEPIKRSRADGSERTVEWVPSGKAHVLAWLAHGAPGGGIRPMFAGLSPQKLFREVVCNRD